jgi:hypothetical protein
MHGMIQIAKLTRKRLGEILIEEGILKEDQLVESLRRQKETGELLGDVLVQLGFLSETDIARALVKQFGLPFIDASNYQVSRQAIESVPPELMWQHRFIVLDKIGKTLLVALSGVLNAEVIEEIGRVSQSQPFVYVSTSSQVVAALQKNLPRNGGSGKKK